MDLSLSGAVLALLMVQTSAMTTAPPSRTTTFCAYPPCAYGCRLAYGNGPNACPTGCNCTTETTTTSPTTTTTVCPTWPMCTCPGGCTYDYDSAGCAIACRPCSTETPTTISSTTTAVCPPGPTCPAGCSYAYDTLGCIIGCQACTTGTTGPTTTSTTTAYVCTSFDWELCLAEGCYIMDPYLPEYPCGGCSCPDTTGSTLITPTPTSAIETTTSTSESPTSNTPTACSVPTCPDGCHLVHDNNGNDGCPRCKCTTCKNMNCNEGKKCQMIDNEPRCVDNKGKSKREIKLRDLLLLSRIRPENKS